MRLNQKSNKMKDWLKGGLIGGVIFLFLEALFYLGFFIFKLRLFNLKIISNFFGWIIITFFANPNRTLFYNNYNGFSSTIVGFIFSLFIWFILGLLVALIITKIINIFKKNKNAA